VLSAAVQAGGGMVWLAVLGVLTSVMGAFYYLRVIVYMFMKEPKEGAPIAIPMKSGYVVVALALAAVLVVAMGLVPSYFLHMPLEAAQHLMP
jgi:NADH-quinone oxidoreductase subunit N